MQDQTTIVTALIGFLGVVVGYFAKYYLDKKRAFSSENAKIKRDMYKVFIDALHESVSHLASATVPEQQEAIRRVFADSARSFYSTSVLFASPQVVKAYAVFAEHARNGAVLPGDASPYELLFQKAQLYKAMRKDIGLSNRGLGWDGELLLRANSNDYQRVIRRYTSWSVRLRRVMHALSVH